MAQYKRPYREFGLRMKAARVRADLTQEEMSIKIDGLSVYAVRLYEQGRCLPSARMLHEIVTLLGITTADLFEEVSA